MIATATTELLQAARSRRRAQAGYVHGRRRPHGGGAPRGPDQRRHRVAEHARLPGGRPGKQIPLHTHTADEVFVVLDGEGIVTSGDRRWYGVGGLHRGRPGVRAARLGEHGRRRSGSRASSARTSS